MPFVLLSSGEFESVYLIPSSISCRILLTAPLLRLDVRLRWQIPLVFPNAEVV